VDAKKKPEQEMVPVRQGAVEAFLQLQGTGVEGKTRWKNLMAEVLALSLPRTLSRAISTNSNCTFSSKAAAATTVAASS